MSVDAIDKVKAIIFKSGNTFHSQVLKYLQDKGWTVLISPYYNDNATNKPREIDLIAEKAFETSNRRYFRTVNVKLFIECKYIPQLTVFWFHSKDMQKAQDLVIKTASLRKDNSYTEKHHYLADVDRVAKLFADERSKSAENEIFYKALNQSLNAMVYYRDRGSIIKYPDGGNNHIVKTLNYPVILCNSFDNLYRVEINLDKEPSRIQENFQLEVNYAYMSSNNSNMNEYFLIDIVDFSLFDDLLKKVEADARICLYILKP